METQNIEAALFGSCLCYFKQQGGLNTQFVSHTAKIITSISKCELTKEYLFW